MQIETRSRTILVTEMITRYITSNDFSHGDRLSSEAEMAKILGVSRNTVREAYIVLEQEGWILRKHGIGTIIVRTSLTNSHYSVKKSFPRMIRDSGRTVGFRHEKRYNTQAPLEAMSAFDLKEPAEIFSVSRVICADDVPAVFHIDYFRPGIKHSDLDWSQFDGDMVDFLELSFGEKNYLYQTRIVAENLNTEIAELLEIPSGTPSLVLRGVVYSHHNMKPLVYAMTYQNPNVFDITLSGTLNGTLSTKK